MRETFGGAKPLSYGVIFLPQVGNCIFCEKSHGTDGVQIPALMHLRICIQGRSLAVLKHGGGGGSGGSAPGSSEFTNL